MKNLINGRILNKFKDTISEDDYKTGWEKLQSYQAEADLIKTKSETTFQSEFLAKVFDNILGYKSSSNHSLKESNLLVEHKNPNSGEKTDGVVLDKTGEVLMVIELKSVKDTTGTALANKKRGGSDGKTPLQQAAVYLFQFPKSTLAVVSNFDTVIVFDRKEAFRQEFSLFDMDYETFKEFYLILSSNSFFGGLTQMMIRQSEAEEKSIDDEFFIKVKNLKKILKNTMKDTAADDLFNKFLALALLEDNGRLPTNLINTIHNMKDDFTHTYNHWGVWSKFFKSLKNHKPGRKLMGIDPVIAGMEVWQNVSYLGRTKIQKSTLDLVVEISKYDLFSIPLQELFYKIAIQIDSPYHEVLTDNPYKFYSELLKDNRYGCDQAASFITLKTYDDSLPLIKLFNQISPNRVVVDTSGVGFAVAPNPNLDDYWTLRDLVDLAEKDTVNLIKQRASTIQLYETPQQPNRSYVLFNLTCIGSETQSVYDIPLLVNYDNGMFELDRRTINNRIILLSSQDQQWLDDRLPNSKQLSEFATIVDEKDADLRMNLDTKKVIRKDIETGRWEFNDDFVFDEENCLYLKVKNSDVYYMLNSSDFSKTMDLIDWKKESFTDLPIFDNLLQEDWLSTTKKYMELKKTIALYEHKLDKERSNGASEIKLLEIEAVLDNLYDEESEYEC